MAEYFAGSIVIGGNVSASQLAELIDVLIADGAEALSVDRDFIDEIASQLNCGEITHVECNGDQLRYGSFPLSEAYCVKAGVPFIRSSDRSQHDGYEAEDCIFTGEGQPTTIQTSACIRDVLKSIDGMGFDAFRSSYEILDYQVRPMKIV